MRLINVLKEDQKEDSEAGLHHRHRWGAKHTGASGKHRLSSPRLGHLHTWTCSHIQPCWPFHTEVVEGVWCLHWELRLVTHHSKQTNHQTKLANFETTLIWCWAPHWIYVDCWCWIDTDVTCCTNSTLQNQLWWTLIQQHSLMGEKLLI